MACWINSSSLPHEPPEKSHDIVSNFHSSALNISGLYISSSDNHCIYLSLSLFTTFSISSVETNGA